MAMMLAITPETRQKLAAEQEYVDALGLASPSEKIDKYRELLKQCLDQDDAEKLDFNLDDLIEMMEEERSEIVIAPVNPATDPMMIC